jgi:hypothetical protein
MVLSAPRLSRKKVIKVALESTMGTKVAGTQALLTYDFDLRPAFPFEERKGPGLYLGHTEKGVHGERLGTCSFLAELRGDGSQGMEAGLAILLQAVKFKKTLEVYQVHSTHTNDKTISIDSWEDGKKKGLSGASGTVAFAGTTGRRMMLRFEFTGVWQTVPDEALPANAPSTTKPLLMQAGTFTLAGESIKIGSFELNMGCNVVPRLDVDATGGVAYCMITDIDPVISMDAEADLVAGYDYYGVMLAGTTAAVSLALTDGTDTITFTIPAVQYREVPEGDRDGIAIHDIVGQCVHSSGDDSVAIAVT